MGGDDVFFLIAQWLHALAAAAWVGGGLLLFLGRLRGGEQASALSRALRPLFPLVAPVLVLTGIVLTFHRLTAPTASGVYGAVLGVKIALALGLFLMAHRASRATSQGIGPGRRWGLFLLGGVVIYFLAELLQALTEAALRGR
jgi:putative copper export protein